MVYPMKHTHRAFAGLSTLALLLGVPGLAFAQPVTETPTTVEAQAARTKVLVTLSDQPTTPGNQLANLKKVNALISTLREKYSLDVDRSFGYLVNGFSAYVDTDAIASIAAEPGVGAVEKVRLYYPTMDAASELTLSKAAREHNNVDGEGLLVSIIDTGIDIAHQDMRIDAGKAKKKEAAAGFNEKVPFGYNFADENNEVNDLTSSQHGMHVAGIVAANSDVPVDVVGNGRVEGVAPNAQLLAMKVFSNDPRKGAGAMGDDIIAAIEESVKQGADVINMSLGSANGLDGDEVGEQRAIANARAAGVEVVVAAGNEGLNYASRGETDDQLGLLDDGTIGGPSTGTDAWSVASIENSKIVNTIGYAGAAGGADANRIQFPYDGQVGTPDGKPHKIVDAGNGGMLDFPQDTRGNYVLIARGVNRFSDMFFNAQINGAIGVIVYNHAQGGDAMEGMADIDKYAPMVGAAIGHNDGLRIKELIAAGNAEVTLTYDRAVRANPDSLHPSKFSSWGASSDLSFKPEIAGIGGNVYSTVGGNKYAVKSGTSMAAPHVAGVATLMLQDGIKKHPEMSRGDLVLRNRVALSNTASIPMHDDSVPYAPRQVGAGLVQTDTAMKTSVLATVEGKPNAALKEVRGSTSFTVTLKNESSEPRTFAVSSTCVVNETNAKDTDTTTSCTTSDTITASKQTVEVPGNGTATVDYTLNVRSGNHWVEGWVTFESKTAGQPNLSLPYLGFAGDWNEERIIDYPGYAGNPAQVLSALEKNPMQSALYTKINEGELTFKDGEQAMSPNGDTYADVVYPKAALLRNAKIITASVLDSNGKEIRVLGSKDNQSRFTLPTIQGELANSLQVNFSDIAFDGKVYNPQKAAFEVVSDGKYVYRLAAKLAADREPQFTDFNFTVDTKGPQIEIVSVKKADGENPAQIVVRVSDEGTGINAVQGLMSPFPMVRGTDNGDGTWTITVPYPGVQSVEVYASDLATNVVRRTVVLNDSHLILDAAADIEGNTLNPLSAEDFSTEPLIENDQLIIRGRVAGDVKQVRIGNDVVDIDETGKFIIKAPIDNGANTVTVEALGADGSVLESKDLAFTYDGVAPVITLTAPAGTPDVPAVLNPDGTLTVTGKVEDNITKVTEVTVDGETVQVGADGVFTVNVTPDPSLPSVTVEARDGAWNRSKVVIPLARPADTTRGLTLKANVNFGEQFNFVQTTDSEVVQDPATGEYTLVYHGTFNRTPKSFAVNGTPVEVKADGTFSTVLPLKQGINDYNVKIVDQDDMLQADTKLTVLFDSKAPGMELSEPAIDADGALYLKAAGDVNIAGKVWDNAFGYAFTVNGNAVKNFLSTEDPTVEANTREFSYKVLANDGDKILLAIYDQAGNAYAQLVPVVVDGQAPTIEVKGVTENEVIPADRQITAKVKDDHLAEASVYLDGKLVEARQVTVKKAEGAVTELVGEPNDVAAGTDLTKPAVAGSATADSTSTVPAAGTSALSTLDTDSLRAATPETGEGFTELTVTLPTPLSSGKHELVVYGADKAGNRADQSVGFVVNATPTISGPDAITVKAEENARDQILAALTLSDDLDTDDTLKAQMDLSGLVPGQTVNVTVKVADSNGAVAEKVIAVTLTMPAGLVPTPQDQPQASPNTGIPHQTMSGIEKSTKSVKVKAKKARNLANTGTVAGSLTFTALGLIALGTAMKRRKS